MANIFSVSTYKIVSFVDVELIALFFHYPRSNNCNGFTNLILCWSEEKNCKYKEPFNLEKQQK